MIEHETGIDRGEFYIDRDGQRLAKMTYRQTAPGRICVDHTEVSDLLKGQGIGKQMLDALVAWARTTGTKVEATCPYAQAQFRKDDSLRDVLAG